MFDPGRSDVFTQLPKNVRRTGFDTELNAFAAGPFHFYQQLFVNCSDSRLAVPEDFDLLILQKRAEFKDPPAVSRKGVIAYRKIDQAELMTNIPDLFNNSAR